MFVIDGIYIKSHHFIIISIGVAIDGFELRYHSQIEMKENSSGGGRKEGWKEGGSRKTNSIDTCRRGRDRILLPGVARNWLWADKGDCFFHCYRFPACEAKTASFCKRATWLGLVERVLEKVAKACFKEIAAPVNQKSHLC